MRRLLLVILLVAALLRLVALGREDLWLDECFTVMVARQPSFGAMVAVLARDISPPLAYVAARAGLALEPLLGQEAALRLPSALAGIGAVLAVFAFARARAGPRAALLAAAWVAVHAAAVAHAREARFYALEVLLAALLLRLADRTAARWRPLDALGLGVVGALLVLAHTLGAALVAARGAWLLVEAARDRRTTLSRRGLAVALATAVLAAPLLPFASLARDHARFLFVDDNVRVHISGRTLEGIIRDLAGSDGATHAREAIVVVTVLVLLGCVAAFRRRRAGEVVVLGLCLFGPLAAFALWPPRQLYPRYFEFALPLVALLAARGALLIRERARHRRLAFAVAATALVVTQLRPLRDELAAPALPYRAVAAWLEREHFVPGDRVLVHFHGTPGPGEPAAERFGLSTYCPEPVKAALTDVYSLEPEAPPARTFGVITLRRRHALAEGARVEGAETLARRIVVLPPGPPETPRAAVRRLAEVDARLPEHDARRWEGSFGRFR